MISNQQLAGQWNQLKGSVRQRWGRLTDDELQMVKGSTERLIGLIQEKTGESRQSIENFLDSALEQGSAYASRISEKASHLSHESEESLREKGHKIGDRAHREIDQASEKVRRGLHKASLHVRKKPIGSVASAFGVGIFTGAMIGMMMSRR